MVSFLANCDIKPVNFDDKLPTLFPVVEESLLSLLLFFLSSTYDAREDEDDEGSNSEGELPSELDVVNPFITRNIFKVWDTLFTDLIKYF